MKKQFRLIMVLMLLAALLAFPTIAFAHQTVKVGDYNVEYGWVNEPAVVGQPNAVVINITPKDFAASGGAQPPDQDVSAFTIMAMFGGQNKMLALQPLQKTLQASSSLLSPPCAPACTPFTWVAKLARPILIRM